MPASNMGTGSPFAGTMLPWVAGGLLVIGLLGHVLSAHAIGGSQIAYKDHLVGFSGILVISGALIAGLGRLFWRHRAGATVLAIAAVQAVFGIVVYILTVRGH